MILKKNFFFLKLSKIISDNNKFKRNKLLQIY